MKKKILAVIGIWFLLCGLLLPFAGGRRAAAAGGAYANIIDEADILDDAADFALVRIGDRKDVMSVLEGQCVIAKPLFVGLKDGVEFLLHLVLKASHRVADGAEFRRCVIKDGEVRCDYLMDAFLKRGNIREM